MIPGPHASKHDENLSSDPIKDDMRCVFVFDGTSGPYRFVEDSSHVNRVEVEFMKVKIMKIITIVFIVIFLYELPVLTGVVRR